MLDAGSIPASSTKDALRLVVVTRAADLAIGSTSPTETRVNSVWESIFDGADMVSTAYGPTSGSTTGDGRNPHKSNIRQ